jgi:hypothetical protein
MTEYIRTRNALILAKIEVSEGVDPTPSPSANAVRVENIQWSETPNVVQSNEVSGALDMAPPLVAGVRSSVSFDYWVKSRAAADTAPDCAALLKMCGKGETITGTAVPGSAEALAAGASAVQCTLGSSASGTADLYNGMPINFTGTVIGQSFLADYTAAKLATLTDTMGGNLTTSTTYQIPKNVVYRDASSSLASGALWFYLDGQKFMMLGARGSYQIVFVSGEGIKIRFTFQGVWVQSIDTSMVTPSNFNDVTKLVWRGLNQGYARSRWNRLLAQVKTLTFDGGNTVVTPDNPEATEGYDPAQITLRTARFTMDPLRRLYANRDFLTDMRTNATRILHARAWNGSAGGGFAVTAANAQVDQNGMGDRDGFSVEQITGRCTGDNDALSVCFY